MLRQTNVGFVDLVSDFFERASTVERGLKRLFLLPPWADFCILFLSLNIDPFFEILNCLWIFEVDLYGSLKYST